MMDLVRTGNRIEPFIQNLSHVVKGIFIDILVIEASLMLALHLSGDVSFAFLSLQIYSISLEKYTSLPCPWCNSACLSSRIESLGHPLCF